MEVATLTSVLQLSASAMVVCTSSCGVSVLLSHAPVLSTYCAPLVLVLCGAGLLCSLRVLHDLAVVVDCHTRCYSMLLVSCAQSMPCVGWLSIDTIA